MQKKINSITEQVKKILADHTEFPIEAILPDSHFCEDVEMDSIDFVEFIMVVEEHFGIEVPDEDADQTNTLETLVQYIYERTY